MGLSQAKAGRARGNVFFAHVLVAFAGALLGLVTATQYVAHALRYDRQLGQPWTSVAGVRLYAPWSWLLWDLKYERFAPATFSSARWITYIGFGITFGGLVLLAVRRARRVESSGAYGTARWATREDLNRAALLNDHGVVLCQTADAKFKIRASKEKGTFELTARRQGTLVRHAGPEHVLVFAPTRSGKGVGVVIPSLLSFTESTVVWDVKCENWTATAGWRRRFSHCWRFEPTAPDSVRFNPLLEVRRGDFEVRDAQVIADMLVDPSGEKSTRDHWQATAQTLLTAGILHVLYAEEDKTLRGLARLFSDPGRAQFDTLERMRLFRHLPSGPHSVVAEAAREMLNKSDNELSGVLSTVMTCLSLYRDPLVAAATAASDFRLADLMNADAPVSLYLVVPPGDIDRTKPLIRLILNQIGRRLTETMGSQPDGQGAYKHRLLFLLDEFPSLGHLAFFDTSLTYLAGYGIKCVLIAQSLRQLEKHYGPNNSILDNTQLKLTYGALDDHTAERVSKLLGTATEHRRQVNFGGNRLSPWLGHITDTDQELARPLLTPGEVLQLPFDEALLIAGSVPPYLAKKVVYYQDPRFKERAYLPPPDSPEEQVRELIPGAPASDWLTLPRPEPVASAPSPAPAVPLSSPDRQVDLEPPDLEPAPSASAQPEEVEEASPSAPADVAPFSPLWNDFLPPPPAGTDPAAVEHERATTASTDDAHHHPRHGPDRDIPL